MITKLIVIALFVGMALWGCHMEDNVPACNGYSSCNTTTGCLGDFQSFGGEDFEASCN